MTIQTFIEKAIEGGWRFTCDQFSYVQNINDAPNLILLDPEAWKAVGVALGNKNEMRCESEKCDSRLCEYAGYWDWKRKMVCMVEAIVYSDMTPERYLATL